MYGAFLGDMIGAPYEFDRSPKTKKFPLFSRNTKFTDDSVMTVAVAEALLDAEGKTDDEIRRAVVHSMCRWGRRYPGAGYGGRFAVWLSSRDPRPYGSYGNGSAMRVSSAGWLYDTIKETRHIARLTAEVTHNHPEGIKGAEAVASAIFLARTGADKEKIREYIMLEFGYDLSRTCDEIRPSYHHVESCQKTVPEAITAFLEGTDFEDAIRTAVSLGGDCDTVTCITGSIAEAFYGIPDKMVMECRKRLCGDQLEVLDRFRKKKQPGRMVHSDSFHNGNGQIETAVHTYFTDPSRESLSAVLDAIRQRIHEDGELIIPVILLENGDRHALRTVQTDDGKEWPAAFTSHVEYEKGQPCTIRSGSIGVTLKNCLQSDVPGIILNPWGELFMLSRDLIDLILKADSSLNEAVPESEIRTEGSEDGMRLKQAVENCNRKGTLMDLLGLHLILEESCVWIPCNIIMGDADRTAIEKMVEDAERNNELDALNGMTLISQEEIRIVPDILQKDGQLFFPVFTSPEEMGEYGRNSSKIRQHFLETACMAVNDKKNIAGIVINAFSESPFVLSREELLLMMKEKPSAAEEG